MKEITYLEEHYNKFSEEKRLTRKHGQVEYRTSMKYIHKYLELLGTSNQKENIKILDIGAGTGAYSIPLAQEGYDVSAVELVKYNVGMLKAKQEKVKAYQGSALNLKRFEDETFHLTLLFGPMYHLFATEDKIKALEEAKRVTRKDGVILVAYLMNEYSVLIHGFRNGFIKECMENGQLTEDFHVKNGPKDLYDYVRISDINFLNTQTGLKRIQMIAATGAANYMRQALQEMDEETFEIFMAYHFATCEREELLGASSHIVDIVQWDRSKS